MLERWRCSSYENVLTIKGYANQVDLENHSCDAISSVQTFEYIDNVDDLIYFKVNDIDMIFNRLCRIGYIKNFEWLFNNNLYLSINNILTFKIIIFNSLLLFSDNFK